MQVVERVLTASYLPWPGLAAAAAAAALQAAPFEHALLALMLLLAYILLLLHLLLSLSWAYGMDSTEFVTGALLKHRLLAAQLLLGNRCSVQDLLVLPQHKLRRLLQQSFIVFTGSLPSMTM